MWLHLHKQHTATWSAGMGVTLQPTDTVTLLVTPVYTRQRPFASIISVPADATPLSCKRNAWRPFLLEPVEPQYKLSVLVCTSMSESEQ